VIAKISSEVVKSFRWGDDVCIHHRGQSAEPWLTSHSGNFAFH